MGGSSGRHQTARRTASRLHLSAAIARRQANSILDAGGPECLDLRYFARHNDAGDDRWKKHWQAPGHLTANVSSSARRRPDLKIFSRRHADGSEHGDPLATGTTNQRAAFTSPDGQRLFFTQAETNISNIWVLPLAGKQQPQQVLKTRFNENYPAPSPDGQWLAYVSDESGRAEVYVQPYPGPGAKVSISANGGTGPAWRADGRELYYQEPIVVAGAPEYKMMAVAVTAQPSFTAEKPRMLFQTPFGYAANVRGYDVTPDGQRFLMVQPKDTTPIKPAEMILVQNWFEELKRRVPVH